MNTPSPLVPQGTTPAPRRRSLPTAFFLILFAHVGVLGLLLLQGCKDNAEPTKPVVEAPLTPPSFGADPGASNALPGGISHDSSNALAGVGAPVPPPGVPSGIPPANLGGNPAGAPAPGGLAPIPAPIPAPVAAPVAPLAPETATTSTPSTEHTVMKGETLAVIAKKYGMGWKAIAAANPGVDSAKLKIGQKLIIPAKTVSAAAPHADAGTGAAAEASGASSSYTVKSGDTLAKIAKGHGISVKALKSANGLKLDKISVGQKLKIPAKHTTAPVEPAPAPAPAPAPSPTPLPGLPGAGVPAPAPDASPVSLPPPTRTP